MDFDAVFARIDHALADWNKCKEVIGVTPEMLQQGYAALREEGIIK